MPVPTDSHSLGLLSIFQAEVPFYLNWTEANGTYCAQASSKFPLVICFPLWDAMSFWKIFISEHMLTVLN